MGTFHLLSTLTSLALEKVFHASSATMSLEPFFAICAIPTRPPFVKNAMRHPLKCSKVEKQVPTFELGVRGTKCKFLK